MSHGLPRWFVEAAEEGDAVAFATAIGAGGAGTPGPKGDKGDPGDPGTPGAPGDPGPPGEDGANGTNGTNGAAGEQGIQGIQGIQGVKGDKGDTGDAGAPGTNGTNGTNGTTTLTGQINAASGTLEATAGRTLLIFGSGAWGNSASALVANLNYNGNVIATHPLKQAATADRTGLSLVGRVTAVASATASVTVTGGTLYNPRVTWIEVG